MPDDAVLTVKIRVRKRLVKILVPLVAYAPIPQRWKWPVLRSAMNLLVRVQ